MLGTTYKRSGIWKKLPLPIQSVSIIKVHNWTAYIALVLIFLHPVLLLVDTSTKFQLGNILVPFNAPHQSVWVGLGVLSFYAFIIVIITSQRSFRRKLGFRAWKSIHLTS